MRHQRWLTKQLSYPIHLNLCGVRGFEGRGFEDEGNMAQFRMVDKLSERLFADQTSADDPGVDVGYEIIVTATKRAQTLQDTPVAVSVTTADPGRASARVGSPASAG